MTAPSPLPGLDTVGLIITNGPDYLRQMKRLLDAGRVVVPLREPRDSERLKRTETAEIVEPEPGHGWIDADLVLDPSHAPALVSFTSGTAGQPKAVVLSHGNLCDIVGRLNVAMALDAGVREYIAVPVSHSFGFGRARCVCAAGGAAYVPPRFDLDELHRMLAEGEVNALSAVPSQLRLLLQNLDRFDGALSTIRWVEIGSQPMSGSEKRRLRDALPNARIVQHYGLTEASRSTLLRVHEAPDDRLDTVGRAEGHVEVRLSAAGEIETRGPHVALGVDDTGVWSEFGPEAWFATGDRGSIDDGWVSYHGRTDDIINCGGLKLDPDAIEAWVREALPKALDFAVLRRADPLRGEAVCLATGPGIDRPDDLREEVEREVRRLGVTAGNVVETRQVPDIPRTETGKVRRRDLEKRLAAPERQSREGGLQATIEDILGPGSCKPGTTFNALGGDSLQHMQMVLLLEQHFGRPPPNWEAEPLSDLAARAELAAVTGEAGRLGARPPLPDGARNQNPDDIGFWALVAEDYRTNDASLTHQGFLMLFVHRFGNWRMDVRPKLFRAPFSLLYRFLNKCTQLFFGMKLDYTVKVGRRVKLEHFGGMILGAREIGHDTILRQNTTLGIRTTDDVGAKPVIGPFVDIGAGAVIVGDVTIGENSIIGANSVVYTNVPPNSVVVGVPGRIIGQNPRRNPSPLGMRGR